MDIEEIEKIKEKEIKMQLVAKISGTIEESNFPEFKRQMMRQIEGADKKLETESDYTAAAETVKLCKTTIKKIKACQRFMIEDMDDVSGLMAGLIELAKALTKTKKNLGDQIRDRRASRILAAMLTDHRPDKEEEIRGVSDMLAEWECEILKNPADDIQ